MAKKAKSSWTWTNEPIPAHATKGSIEAIAVIYERAAKIRLRTPLAASDVKLMDEIMVTCEHYLPGPWAMAIRTRIEQRVI